MLRERAARVISYSASLNFLAAKYTTQRLDVNERVHFCVSRCVAVRDTCRSRRTNRFENSILMRISNAKTNVIASGIQTSAVAALLVHESPRRGDLAVFAGRLRNGILGDMDSGKIVTLRMGGAVALSEL